MYTALQQTMGENAGQCCSDSQKRSENPNPEPGSNLRYFSRV